MASSSIHIVVLPIVGLPYIHSTHAGEPDLDFVQKAINPDKKISLDICYKQYVFVRPSVAAENTRWDIARRLLKSKAAAWIDDNGVFEGTPNFNIGVVPRYCVPCVFGNIALVVPNKFLTVLGITAKDLEREVPGAAAPAPAAPVAAGGAGAPPAPAQQGVPCPGRACSACGMVGHNKTNKKCKYYGKPELMAADRSREFEALRAAAAAQTSDEAAAAIAVGGAGLPALPVLDLEAVRLATELARAGARQAAAVARLAALEAAPAPALAPGEPDYRNMEALD